MKHFSSITPKFNLTKTALAVLMILTFSAALFSQDKSGGNEPANIFYSNSSDGSTSNPVSTSNQPQEQQFTAEKQTLLNQLRTARLNNDLVQASQLRNRLDEIDGLTAYTPVEITNPDNNPIKQKFVTMNTRVPFMQESDFSVSTISTAAIWGVATASSNRTSTIFAATSEYVNGGGDIIKIFVSYNGGSSWVLKYTYNGFNAAVDCRAGEIDIEPIISGNDTIVYCAVGINYNSHAWSTMIVANIGTGVGAGYTWSFGGYNNANVNYYNPKVTSDNTTYTSASYVYMTSSFDSAGTVRYTSRYLLVTSPFTTTPVFTYRQPNAPNGFWWQSNGISSSAYLHQDICYYNNGTVDRIYIVYNHAGTATDKSVFIAWSNDYGVTVGSGNTLSLTEATNILGAVCAANGGTSRTTMAIGYRLQYANEWDYRIQYSAGGGTTTGMFTGQYIEYTGDTTMLISLQAIDLANGRFVTGSARNGGEHYYRSFNGTTLGNPLQTNNITGDVTYGGCRAGYWNSPNPDSCIVVWSPNLGSGAYCSRLICSTVGVEPTGNEVPAEFSLKQNYPNPFNPVTNIKFSIPRSSFVKITVFDITGREVAKLVNENMNAGSYTVDFDASDLATGVYLYRIDADGFTAVKKMMLIK
ncbi:MAG TPA: T9SS type A sorting domain-containing protein [Ignavibacteria bacterium]|nr:T9SS type A sorting domain-containing protein [Ignavibacteria bacterium]